MGAGWKERAAREEVKEEEGEGGEVLVRVWQRDGPLWEALQFCAFSLLLPQSLGFTWFFHRQFSKIPPKSHVKRAVLYIAACRFNAFLAWIFSCLIKASMACYFSVLLSIPPLALTARFFKTLYSMQFTQN